MLGEPGGQLCFGMLAPCPRSEAQLFLLRRTEKAGIGHSVSSPIPGHTVRVTVGKQRGVLKTEPDRTLYGQNWTKMEERTFGLSEYRGQFSGPLN